MLPETIEKEELCIERAVPKSTRYKNKWSVPIFEHWQQVRSVKFPIVEEYELDKVRSLTQPITEMLNCQIVKEVAKCSKDPYPLKTLHQIVSSICRFMVGKNPAIEFNPLDSSGKRCVNWSFWREGPLCCPSIRLLA